jgi:uncharacterized protein (UPF0335 family)
LSCPTNTARPTSASSADRAGRAPARGKKGISDDIRDVFGEMKSAGCIHRCVRQIIRLRKMKPDDRREMEAILEVYKNALGID